jgi:hypothetical protein
MNLLLFSFTYPQKALSVRKASLFFICFRNHCKFKPYLYSLFAAEIVVNSNRILLLYFVQYSTCRGNLLLQYSILQDSSSLNFLRWGGSSCAEQIISAGFHAEVFRGRGMPGGGIEPGTAVHYSCLARYQLSYTAPLLSHAHPNLATPHPAKPRRTLLATPHPPKPGRTQLSHLAPLISHAEPY